MSKPQIPIKSTDYDWYQSSIGYAMNMASSKLKARYEAIPKDKQEALEHAKHIYFNKFIYLFDYNNSKTWDEQSTLNAKSYLMTFVIEDLANILEIKSFI